MDIIIMIIVIVGLNKAPDTGAGLIDAVQLNKKCCMIKIVKL